MVWQQIHDPLSSMTKSTVVTSTAPRCFTREGDVPRDAYFYSVALACVLGLRTWPVRGDASPSVAVHPDGRAWTQRG
jgi:hypothetical protein